MQLDGILTSRELNIFGKIINDPFFKSITPSSFDDREFENISHVPEGITRYGFFQLMAAYPEKKIYSMLDALGYDESLQSAKSRVFVITFHSTEEIRVKIGNTAKSDITEKSMNLMMADYLDKMGANKAKEDENVIVFRKYHEKSYASSFAAVNKTSNDVRVSLDMTHSQRCCYTPSNGKSVEIIPPHSVKYLGACIVKPKEQSFSTAYSFTSKRL